MSGIVWTDGLLGYGTKRWSGIFQRGGVIADIGCGQEAAFLMHCSPFIQKGYGFDFRIHNRKIRNLKLVNNKDADGLDVEEQCCDAVFMLAVLEHLDHPYNLLKEIHRILKTGGTLCLTTPTPIAKPVLECMAKMRMINRDEILEHKHYYTNQEMQILMKQCGFLYCKYQRFCFGLNSLVIVQKK